MTAPVEMASLNPARPASDNRQRRDPCTGCPAQFGVRDDKQEFVHMVACGLIEAEVLYHHHPVADVKCLRDYERLTVAFRWVGAEAPRVTPGQCQPVLKNTASPGRTSWPVTASALSASATVITSPG